MPAIRVFLAEGPIFSIRQLLGRGAPAPQPTAAPPAGADALPQAAALRAQGNQWLGQGQLANAVQCYQQACELAPGDPLAWVNLGYARLELGELEAADQALAHAIERDPKVADAHFLLAQLRLRQRRPAEALAPLRMALALNPAFDVAAQLLVSTLLDMLRWQEALAEADGLLARMDTPPMQLLRMRALIGLKRGPEALAIADAMVAAYPQEPQAIYARAQALFALRRFQEALDCCAFVLQAQPQHLEAMVNGGAACARMGRWDEAAAFYDRALAIQPDYSLALYNKSSMYQEMGRIPEMLALVDRGLALQPGEPNFIWSRGVGRLLQGDLVGGFQDYESRWILEVAEARPQVNQPQWQGQDLQGKTIYVYDEQGLGDTLQMLRYVPMLVQRGAKVLLRVQPSLMPLAQYPGCTLLDTRRHPIHLAFDYHCPMLSLPLGFGTALGTVPWSGPYVSADPALRAGWEQWLGPRRGLRIGLTWSGNADHRNDANRSMRLDTMLAGLGEGHQLVSVQKDIREVDREALARVQHAGEQLRNFSDTAALLGCLDLVISVDTSIAHLAGALGRPLWVLLPLAPDWRWLSQGDSTPWYPQARLFRQGEDRHWPAVLQRVAQELARQDNKEKT